LYLGWGSIPNVEVVGRRGGGQKKWWAEEVREWIWIARADSRRMTTHLSEQRLGIHTEELGEATPIRVCDGDLAGCRVQGAWFSTVW
jgi:hypothetical protein